MNRFLIISLIIINFFLLNSYAFSNEEIIKVETVINDIIILITELRLTEKEMSFNGLLIY